MARYCAHCGYNLEQLPEPRCPECGHIFDFADPKTFRPEDPGVGWRCLKLAIIGLLISVIPGFLLLTATVLITHEGEFWLVLAAIVAFFVLGGVFLVELAVFFGSIIALRDPGTPSADRGKLVAAAVVSSVVMLWPVALVAAISAF